MIVAGGYIVQTVRHHDNNISRSPEGLNYIGNLQKENYYTVCTILRSLMPDYQIR